MTSSFWQDQLQRCPAMRPWLERVARHVVAGEPLPATLTLGAPPQDKAVRQALDTLFGGCREEGGRLKVRLDGAMREPSRWRPLAELFEPEPAQEDPGSPDALLAQTLHRLKVLYPEDSPFIGTLRRSEPLLRFFKTCHTAPADLVSLFSALVSLRTSPAGITLSELGAKCFNDSKALRSGPRRQQLEHLLRMQTGREEEDATSLFSACGIIENPYTTHVVVFAPFTYRTGEGEWLDWPHRLWLRGEAAILSWRTVRTMTALRIEQPFSLLVTSENAAPFHRLVEVRRPALYTEGYPNAAVKSLLRHFAKTGLACLHWGDTDLDGYRIAGQVAGQILSRMYTPPTADPNLHGHLQRLSGEQRQRTEKFLHANPGFPYFAELRQTLAHGWLEQEQSIDLFA